MASSWLTCAQLVELVTDYLEGAMQPSERLEFEEHIAGCAPCRVYVAQMRDTVARVGLLREEDVPEEAISSLLEAFRDWRRR
jgi:anti-sigma factor RsiW